MGKIDLNAKLRRAIVDGDGARAKVLIVAGASVSMHFSMGEKSRLLADVRPETRGLLDGLALHNITPLHLAAIAGQAEIAQILISAGASPKDRGGSCPDDHSGGLKVQPSADMDARFGYHPLHYAALADSPDVARVLLAHGADMEGKAFFHRRPLHVAYKSRSYEMIRFLVLSGANCRVQAILPGEAISALCTGESMKVLQEAIREKDWVKWRKKHIALGRRRPGGPSL